MRGEINSKVDSLFVYALPFPAGSFVTVKRSENASRRYLGHEVSETWSSHAFYSETNDTICAVRKGIVIGIIDEHEFDTLKTTKYTSRLNRILVEHEDGTYAQYSNLDKNNIFVSEGQEVLPQMPLALIHESPNTNKFLVNFLVSYLRQEAKADDYERHFLNPYFYTEDGIVRLENKEYKVVVTDEMLNKELGKKKKKQKRNK